MTDVTRDVFMPNTTAFGNENVRFNKDLDGLGMLGDLGWYAVGAVLWAMQWEVPAWIHTHAGAKHTEDGECG